jgi:hypothetical protein
LRSSIADARTQTGSERMSASSRPKSSASRWSLLSLRRICTRSIHTARSSSSALLFVTVSFLLSPRHTTSSSAGRRCASPRASIGSCCTGCGLTGGIYAFLRGGSLLLPLSFPLGFFSFGRLGASVGGTSLVALRVCFLRVAEDADVFVAPLTM